MNKKYISLLLWVGFLMPCDLLSQSGSTDSIPPDPKYREDQFYASVAVNFMSKLPEGVDQSGFSGSARFGFLRDMPVNQQRNIALAIGAGLNFNTYNQNMKIDNTGTATSFTSLDDEDFNTNRFSTYIFEMPLELRWRTSTTQKNNFWRIYLGFKVGYMFSFKSKFEGIDERIEVKDPDGLERWRYSLTLSGGYSKVNFYLNYSLNSLFSGVNLKNSSTAIEIQPIKAGFIFYIL
jgi:hypothetical protein